MIVMLDVEEIRSKWWGLFDPDLQMSEEDKAELVRSIKEESNTFGDMVLNTTHYDFWYYSFQRLRQAVEDNPVENFPDRYLVAPVLISGLPYGAAVEAYLRRLNKSHGLVLVSSATRYGQDREERKNEFRSGRKVPQGLYIPESELSMLQASSDKPILVVDDIVRTLDSLRSVDKRLEELGFQERYAIVSHGTVYGSQGLRSPATYNKFPDKDSLSMWIS